MSEALQQDQHDEVTPSDPLEKPEIRDWAELQELNDESDRAKSQAEAREAASPFAVFDQTTDGATRLEVPIGVAQNTSIRPPRGWTLNGIPNENAEESAEFEAHRKTPVNGSPLISEGLESLPNRLPAYVAMVRGIRTNLGRKSDLFSDYLLQKAIAGDLQAIEELTLDDYKRVFLDGMMINISQNPGDLGPFTEISQTIPGEVVRTEADGFGEIYVVVKADGVEMQRHALSTLRLNALINSFSSDV